MISSEPMYDCAEAALRDGVRAAGGAKRVGKLLWGSLSVEAAARKLDDTLNPDRREKLDVHELLMVLRLARDAGFHGVAEYIAHECGYARPTPIEPLDERAQLQREYVAAVKSLGEITSRLEQITEVPGPRRVA